MLLAFWTCRLRGISAARLLTFEAKEKRSGSNVAEAVAALSNTDGGIVLVLVGVKDKGTTGKTAW